MVKKKKLAKRARAKTKTQMQPSSGANVSPATEAAAVFQSEAYWAGAGVDGNATRARAFVRTKFAILFGEEPKGCIAELKTKVCYELMNRAHAEKGGSLPKNFEQNYEAVMAGRFDEMDEENAELFRLITMESEEVKSRKGRAGMDKEKGKKAVVKKKRESAGGKCAELLMEAKLTDEKIRQLVAKSFPDSAFLAGVSRS